MRCPSALAPVLAVPVLAAGVAFGATPAMATMPVRLFDSAEYRTASLVALPQWRRVLAQAVAETPLYEACGMARDACPSAGLADWRALLASLRRSPEMARIVAVNAFVNRVPYISDRDNFGRSDYWASPVEFFGYAGDCEDYAIVKYLGLRELGFSADRLRLVVVRDTVRDVVHAVLTVAIDGDARVLDNLNEAVLPQAQLTRYVPYYSFNEEARWAHVPANTPLFWSDENSAAAALAPARP